MINQTTLQQQFEQLQAEHARILGILAERGSSRLGEFVDTLGYSLQLARQGHPGVRQNLATLAEQLKELLNTPGGKIVVPDFKVNGPLKPPGDG